MGSDEQKLPYPKSVFFILSQEFCERFSYYGMRAVLSLYLLKYLHDESLATVIFHVFAMFCYFTPIFGSILADGFIGKFRTIFYLSIVYALGNAILSLASSESYVGLKTDHVIPISVIGLFLICIGTGGIKPCVSAFGGDQFIMPQQEQQLMTFFSIFYFCINAGSLVSTVITPVFRKEITCLGQDTCYPLAFGVPAILMVVSLMVFLFGKPFYKINPPKGNILVKVCRCIQHAIGQKSKSSTSREHWLDHADDKFDKSLIEDIKVVLRVLVLFIPLPVFWALYDQQGSTWTFQANRMDGYTLGWVILPDQFQVINAFLILAFIPLFDIWLYPAMAKVNLLKKPLQRLVTGGMLAGVAFVISGLLELKLQTTNPVIPHAGEMNFNFINTLPCRLSLSLDGMNSTTIYPNQNYLVEKIHAKSYAMNVQLQKSEMNDDSNSMDNFFCNSFFDGMYIVDLTKTFQITGHEKKARSILIVLGKNKTLEIIQPNVDDDLLKQEGMSKLKIFEYGFDDSWQNISVQITPTKDYPKNKAYTFEPLANGTDKYSSFQRAVEPISYDVWLHYDPSNVERIKLGNIQLATGGNYILSVVKNYSHVEGGAGHDKPFAIGLQTVTRPNSVHILWLLPQYIVITVGEIMFSITGLSFSYAEAPESMKSVVQAAWLLTVAFGNLLVVAIELFEFFERQSDTVFLFSGLMFVDMLIFVVMAYFYKPKSSNNSIEMTSDEIENGDSKRNNNANKNSGEENGGFDE